MLIENQVTDEFRKKKYGLFPMSFNGCEIIAVHNALELAGYETDIDRLINLFKRKHLMVLCGLFGSNIFRIHKILEALHISCQKVKLSETVDDGIYIVSFWNRRPPFHGIHTVVTRVSNGIPETYNLYSKAGYLKIAPLKYAGKRFITGYKLFR